VSLLINTSSELPDQTVFTIRGLFNTRSLVYDETTVFMPLAKAQAFTRTEGRASAILMQLDRQENTETVAAGAARACLQGVDLARPQPGVAAALKPRAGIMDLMYLIVLAVVAVVIANTLLMSVFERTREMGILAALGMKGRQ